jgi:hypothetical protein
MANTINEAIETKDILVVNTVSSNDFVIVTANVAGNARTRNIRVRHLFANTEHDVTGANISANLIVANVATLVNVSANLISGNLATLVNVIVTNHTTPANSSANCTMGQFWFDNNYIYLAIANNTIRRVPLEDI